MNTYNQSHSAGNLWLRNITNTVLPANLALSSVFIKYKNTNEKFFYDLNLNNIIKFDTFYDSFFIQTSSGYAFEKIVVNGSDIQPFTQFNSFVPNTYLNIDYWFNESKKLVYYCGFNQLNGTNSSNIIFSFYFNSFDIKTSQTTSYLNNTITLNLVSPSGWSNTNGEKEDPKLTYNSDTNIFNMSFIIRNDFNNLGLISINFNEYEIDEINTFIPFATVNTLSSTIS